jgi:hypothetical protein
LRRYSPQTTRDQLPPAAGCDRFSKCDVALTK